MFGSSKWWGLNSTHIHGTHVPVEEPSTASKADSCAATKPGRSGACSGGRAKKLRFDAGAHGVAQLDTQIDLGERRDAVSVEIVPHAALHRQRRCHVAAGSIRRKARDNLQFAHF